MDTNAMINGFNSSGGMNNLFKSIAMADMVRQKAELEAGTKSAQQYASNMHGNYYAENARDKRMTNDYREGVDGMIAADPSMDQFRKYQLLAYKLAGPSHMDDFSKSGGMEQKTAAIKAIAANPELALPYAKAFFAASGHAPFDNVGNSGYSLNKIDGTQTEGNPVLAKLFGDKTGSEIRENNAQAGAAGALAGLRSEQKKVVQRGSNVFDGTDAQGNQISYTLGSDGLPRILQGVLPGAPKRTGADAAEAKGRLQITRDVAKDPMWSMASPDEQDAEVERRITRASLGGRTKPAGDGGLLQQAKDAIAKGAPRDKVIARLRQQGIDPKGL